MRDTAQADETPPDFSGLRAVYINCTLTPSPLPSHTQTLMDRSIALMRSHGVAVTSLRAVDHDIAPGVQPDMTQHGWPADAWPGIAEQVLGADILVLGTPIWLGDKSSVCTRVIERLYALSGQMNAAGQYAYYALYPRYAGGRPVRFTIVVASLPTPLAADRLRWTVPHALTAP